MRVAAQSFGRNCTKLGGQYTHRIAACDVQSQRNRHVSVVRCAKVSRDLVFVVSLVAAASVAAAEKVSVVALFKDNAMVVLGGRQRLLRKGQRSPEGVTLIQVDAKGATLEIAGKRKLYPLGRQISTQFKAASSSIPVRIWPTAAGMYNASETINGFPVSLHCR